MLKQVVFCMLFSTLISLAVLLSALLVRIFGVCLFHDFARQREKENVVQT